MVLPADPLPLTSEEQGRLLARVYAFILSDKFTGTTREQETQRDIRPADTCQPQLAGIIHEIDAQEFVYRETGK